MFKISFAEPKSMCWEDRVPPEAMGESPLVCSLCPQLQGCAPHWLRLPAPSSTFKASRVASCFSAHIVLFFSNWQPSASLLRTFVMVFMVHPDNSRQSPHLKIFNIISPTKSLVPNEEMFSGPRD